MSVSVLSELVRCPQCADAKIVASLVMDTAKNFRCLSCAQRYPAVGGVPSLLPRPNAWLEHWRNQLAIIAQEADLTLETFEAERRKPALLETTRERLDSQIDLTRQVASEIDAVLLPAVGGRAAEAQEIPGFRPLETLHLLHRDWGWTESDENARALACLEKVIHAPLGRLLVLGAGACRLAYDLHRKHAASLTIALDIDPLALLTADKILNGQIVPLTEARANANEMTRLRALRLLKAPDGPVADFQPLLANGLAPPFRDGVFDTVLTPWFIDLVPQDLREFLPALHRLLTPGGRWLNFGPLLYPMTRPAALRFAREEVFELAARVGFEITNWTSELLPYSLSPLAERGRLEQCLAFSAVAGPRPAPDAFDPPNFLVFPDVPIPDFPGRASFDHPSAALRAIVEAIDGQRSITDVATLVGERVGVKGPALKDAVRHCLLETHPRARKRA